MSDSKFYTLFSVCSDREIAGYHKFLRQTRKNRSDLLRLLDHIRKAFRKPDAEKELSTDFCCQVVYGVDTEGNYKSVLNMMSELHLMLRGYLLAEKVKTDVLESRSLWLSILSEKGLEKEFSQQALSDIKEYETKPKNSVMDYSGLLALQQQYYYNFTNVSPEDGFIQVQKNAEALGAYAEVLRLRMLCEALHLKTKLPDEPRVDSLIQVLKIEKGSAVSDEILPVVYNELRILLESNDFKQFDKVADTVSKNAHRINAKELDELLLYLNSFLSTLSRTNQAGEDVGRTHRLNKIALANKIYFH